jgi:acetyl esterase/lipase
MKPSLRLLAVPLLFLAGQTLRAGPSHDPRAHVPLRIAGVDNHPQVEFLQPAREWERMDLWVPSGPGPHPAVIVFYGGGYGGKVVSPDAIKALVAAGYAVALPDYALGASSPEPLVMWDGADAIRWLRAESGRLRIDPTRIGAWGFSAGGWLVQRLAPADGRSRKQVVRPRNRNQDVSYGWFPVLEPHPALADQPLRLQAVATDWGAERLNHKDMAGVLDPTDPPLLTCHNGGPGVDSPGLRAYREAGAPAELVALDVKNTHVPPGEATGVMHGEPTSWHGAVIAFFDRHLKRPTRATAPELSPAGGPLPGPTRVRLRGVHGNASIRYTLDGGEPDARALRPDGTGEVLVRPGQRLRAASFVEGLEPSPVVTAEFSEGPPPPAHPRWRTDLAGPRW